MDEALEEGEESILGGHSPVMGLLLLRLYSEDCVVWRLTPDPRTTHAFGLHCLHKPLDLGVKTIFIQLNDC